MTDPGANHGTKHVGVRRQGANIWPEPGPEWECFDRETGARIGPLHPNRYEASQYAAERERTTYSPYIGGPLDGPLKPAHWLEQPRPEYDPTPACAGCHKAWDTTNGVLTGHRCPESPSALVHDGGQPAPGDCRCLAVCLPLWAEQRRAADLIAYAALGDPGEAGEVEMGLCPCGKGYNGHAEHRTFTVISIRPNVDPVAETMPRDELTGLSDLTALEVRYPGVAVDLALQHGYFVWEHEGTTRLLIPGHLGMRTA